MKKLVFPGRGALAAAAAVALSLFALVAPAPAQQAGFRTEKDLLGEKQIPADAYYGVQTAARAREFPDLGRRHQPLPRLRRGLGDRQARRRARQHGRSAR